MNFELRADNAHEFGLTELQQSDENIRAGWGGCSQCSCQAFMGNNTDAPCENCFHGYHFHS